MNKQNLKFLGLWFLVLVVILMYMFTGQGPVPVNYSRFKQLLREGKIDTVAINKELITGKYIDDKGSRLDFKTVPIGDPKLIEELETYQVRDYRGQTEQSIWKALFFNFGPILLFLALWFFMVRQMQGGGKQAMAFGRSKAKQQSGKKIKVTFAEVAGCEESKEELREIIEFLKDPPKFQRLGGKIPKGVLVYGAPGTGKTLLAKAVAGEAGVPFFSSSGSEFVEMFVGVGASRVRDLFEQGRRNAPCLLFVDEIDAVGRHRFAGIGGGHDEREQTLNQLLVEMDGFDTKEGVILIAATNRPDVLDPALLRPGRFDRQIMVPTPDLKGREEILKVHAKNVKLAAEVDLRMIARRSPGFVGADLANLINEAALLAARHNKEAVEMVDLEEAIDRVIAGPQRKSQMISDSEKKIIAYHESGHALIAKLLPGTDPVHKVSIIPRGPALGYTLQLPTEDHYLHNRSSMINRIVVFLGGRVAEELIFKEITTGAQNDLAKATNIAQKMICEYGMSEKLGPLSFRKREEEVFLGRDLSRDRNYSEHTAQQIDEEVKSIIDGCLQTARELVKNNQSKLQRIAEKLVEREVLEGEEFEKIFNEDDEIKNKKQ
ncbi:MAG: ATP-dependent zinc metalloprotease FtsH [Elusimicrobiota bacterium]